ncbi:MAG: GHKL domain-containing protein [Sedimentisphaerales bacterium]|nr:GHKL domain-containing protein [Sedimentisphaerales bacterium]
MPDKKIQDHTPRKTDFLNTGSAEGAVGSSDQLRKDHLHFGRMAQHLINAIPLGVVVFDSRLLITDINPTAGQILVGADNIADALNRGDSTEPKVDWHEAFLSHLKLSPEDPEECTFDNITYIKDGIKRVLHLICTPLTDEISGEQMGGILLIEDVTTMVMMESDLASHERLAAMGKLSARVAHELNNPMDGILRYINLAIRLAENEGHNQCCQYLQEARKGLQRMIKIISELLEFSRSTYSALEEVDINKIMEDAIKTMESQGLRTRIQIERQYTRDLPNVRSGNLFQVFCNLIKNAFDAMSQGGTLTIKTGRDENNLLMEFSDTGSGLSREVQDKLFEPFFTTKDTGKGTGLGLAICKDIIERYNGQIFACNRPQGGATFTISIPVERTRVKKS